MCRPNRLWCNEIRCMVNCLRKEGRCQGGGRPSRERGRREGDDVDHDGNSI